MCAHVHIFNMQCANRYFDTCLFFGPSAKNFVWRGFPCNGVYPRVYARRASDIQQTYSSSSFVYAHQAASQQTDEQFDLTRLYWGFVRINLYVAFIEEIRQVTKIGIRESKIFSSFPLQSLNPITVLFSTQ